jgi:hypothetical protein
MPGLQEGLKIRGRGKENIKEVGIICPVTWNRVTDLSKN